MSEWMIALDQIADSNPSWVIFIAAAVAVNLIWLHRSIRPKK